MSVEKVMGKVRVRFAAVDITAGVDSPEAAEPSSTGFVLSERGFWTLVLISE